MSAAACVPTRLGMLTFADRMAPPQPPMEEEEPAAAAGEGCVNVQLWPACAGSMCTVPPVGAVVYYFPQGHAEQDSAAVDMSAARGVPPFVPCRVAAVRYMAEPHTNEVFARIRLVPLRPGEPVADIGDTAAGEGAAPGMTTSTSSPSAGSASAGTTRAPPPWPAGTPTGTWCGAMREAARGRRAARSSQRTWSQRLG
ncbi:auxin response factor 10-like [Panicum miliaceum]|uniref:Auxin response factor 10-like n=1 Tax=Panicum miliaceum TaxID=4540 RepID=A0A3L6RGM6_PANMI|nr:auxin response factor 10-like [Panicum miliaceum]